MFNFEPTIVGSMPHQDGMAAANLILHRVPEIPAWPQLPRRSFCENMVVPFSKGLPGRVLRLEEEIISLNTNRDMSADLEGFFESYLKNDLAAFAFSENYTAGWSALFELLPEVPGNWVKGQVTGPVSMGMMLEDQDHRPILYNEWLADVLVKNTEMQARWQIQQLRTLRPNILLSIDEPSLSLFGSAYVSLMSDQVVNMLNPVFDAIHKEGALSCVHCCANTDWPLLFRTRVKVLNIDAYGYMDSLSLYPQELGVFLNSGGFICWGIVPNNDDIHHETVDTLAARLTHGMEAITQKARHFGVHISSETFANQSLISTSCGLGATSVNNAEKALQLLPEVSSVLRNHWG
jgi:hypothetical protein